MFGTDAIHWITTEEEAQELEDEDCLSVLTVVAMSDPACKRFLHRYALAADRLRQSRPDIQFFALNVEEYPDLESNFSIENIPYPYHRSGPDLDYLEYNDDNTDIIEKILEEYPEEGAEDLVVQYKHHYHPGVQYLALYFYKDPKDLAKVLSTLETVSKGNNKLCFVTVDVNTSERSHGLDVDPQKAPYFVIDERGGPKYGVYNPSEEAIKQFVSDYNAGNLEPSFRSEPVPDENSIPVKLVGLNHDEILKDTSKSFFIRYHRDSVEGEEALDVFVIIWKELAELFASNPQIVIAELDLALNFVDASVGDFFYPAGDFNGTREVIEFTHLKFVPYYKTFIDMGGKVVWSPELAETSFREFNAMTKKMEAEKNVGKLQPSEQPEKWPLTELNDLSFKEVIEDTSKDAVIWFYQLGIKDYPQLNLLARHFAGDSNVIVGRIDTSSNDVGEQFPWSFENPWLIMYPANGEICDETGLRKPLVYDGPNNIQSLTNFVTTKSPVFDLTAETYPSFVESANRAIVKLYHSSSPSIEDDAVAYEYMFQNHESELLVAQIDLDKEQCVDELVKSTMPLEFEGKVRENIRVIRK
ncbi:hypothetical protein DICA1_F00958 [Diutina catenulata]